MSSSIDQTLLSRRMLGLAQQRISEARDALCGTLLARTAAIAKLKETLDEIAFFLDDPDSAEQALREYADQQSKVCDAAEVFLTEGCVDTAGIEQETRKLQRLRGEKKRSPVRRVKAGR